MLKSTSCLSNMPKPKYEIVDVTDETPASIIVMESMLDGSELGKFVPGIAARIEKKTDRRKWRVQLLVDGVSVPVVKTLNGIWERENARIEERALERAKEMVKEVGLDKIRTVLETASWQIANALEERFGKQT